jgi:hypothetical protein
MVRWDAPLFTVSWMDDSMPGEEIWKAITEGVVKPPNAGTQAVSHILSTMPDVCPPHKNRKNELTFFDVSAGRKGTV